MPMLRRSGWLVPVAIAGIAAVLGVLALHRPLSTVPAPSTQKVGSEGRPKQSQGPRFAVPTPVGAAEIRQGYRLGGDERAPGMARSPVGIGVLESVWSVFRWFLVIATLGGLALAASRLQARSARRMQRVLVTPGRSS